MNVNQPSSLVAQVIQSLVDAWNRRDATRFSNLFSEDAHYIDGDGRWLKGRRAIADLCVGAGEPVSVEEEPSIRIYGEMAIATFRWTSIEDKSSRGIITCAAIKSKMHDDRVDRESSSRPREKLLRRNETAGIPTN